MVRRGASDGTPGLLDYGFVCLILHGNRERALLPFFHTPGPARSYFF